MRGNGLRESLAGSHRDCCRVALLRPGHDEPSGANRNGPLVSCTARACCCDRLSWLCTRRSIAADAVRCNCRNGWLAWKLAFGSSKFGFLYDATADVSPSSGADATVFGSQRTHTWYRRSALGEEGSSAPLANMGATTWHHGAVLYDYSTVLSSGPFDGNKGLAAIQLCSGVSAVFVDYCYLQSCCGHPD